MMFDMRWEDTNLLGTGGAGETGVRQSGLAWRKERICVAGGLVRRQVDEGTKKAGLCCVLREQPWTSSCPSSEPLLPHL